MSLIRKTLLASVLVLGSFSAAHADLATGPFTVTVWNGNGITDSAALPPPTSQPLATFTYTGPIDFINNAPNNGQNTSLNTFADFFGSYTSGISNFVSLSSQTEAQFLATTMSLEGFQYNTYMTLSGTYTASSGTQVSVSHDDGASLYTGANNANTVFTSASPTSEVTNTGLVPAGSDSPFTLVYVESNGSPADLTMSVPEPGSLAMLGLGLVMFGFVLRRRRNV
ncbi:MAG: PEP-CTERM sorting domain-containing protein [Acetobacteraceae bacterium]